MELVKVLDDAGGTNEPVIRLSAESARIAGIETSPVVRKYVSAEVRLFGKINYDPSHVSYINAFMPGVIDRVYIKRAGQFVRWGEPLFDLYSSDLLETQKQLIEAMKYVPSFFAFQDAVPHAAREMPVHERLRRGGEKFSLEAEAAMERIAGIRQKLNILGLPKRDIDELMKKGAATGIATVYSSVYGQIIDQQAFEGSYINTGTPIFTIGDPGYVWVELDAYEMDYPWLRKGQKVTFETDAYPGETFHAVVVYIDPVFNSKTRTFTLGAISPGPGGRLKAGMLVRAGVHAIMTADGKVVNEAQAPGEAPLVIPASAPLITGRRAVVYVKDPEEEGTFEGREIILGPKADGHYIVIDGLAENEEVVKNGSFKLDSAVEILARPSMMSLEGGGSATAHHNLGGSDNLYENYRHNRTRNRLQVKTETPEMLLGGSRERKKPLSRGRRTISRRRPGLYGDTTRIRARPYQ